MNEYELSPDELQFAFAKADFEPVAKAREEKAQTANFIPRNTELYAQFGEKAPLVAPEVSSTVFPTESLEGVILDACNSIKESSPLCPPEIIYQSVLAAATTAVSGYANILMNGDRITSLNNFFVTVGESSAGKSSAMGKAMVPIRRYSDELYEKYTQWVADKASFDETKEQRSMQYEVPPPWSGLFVQNDFTIEALTVALINQPMLTIANSEAGTLLDGYSFKSNKYSTIAAFSLMWDGTELTRNRVKDQGLVYKMPNRRVTMHLMLQNKLAHELLFKDGVEEQGFISRFLMAAPTHYPEYDFMNDLDKDFNASNALMDGYKKNMAFILNGINYSTNFRLQPRLITLPREANALYLAYRNQCVEWAKGEYKDICQTVHKLPQHALKLAGLIELLNHPASLEVSAESTEKAILLCNYYLGEASRLLGVGRSNKNFADAQALWDWLDANRRLCNGDNTILQSAITKGCPSKFRQTSTVKRLCLELYQHGYMRPKSNVEEKRVRWELAP